MLHKIGAGAYWHIYSIFLPKFMIFVLFIHCSEYLCHYNIIQIACCYALTTYWLASTGVAGEGATSETFTPSPKIWSENNKKLA